MIFKIAFRNLIRQKRRNLLLSIGIIFGMTILVIATGFSKGLSDIIFNEIVVHTAGHISIKATESGSWHTSHIRDKDRIIKIIKENVKGIKWIDEGVATFCRAIGNGKSDNIVILGVQGNEEFYQMFKCICGNVHDFTTKDFKYPVLISQSKAESLNVKVNDVIKVRIQNVNGQQQAGNLTVVAIVKNANVFMDIVLFMDLARTKELLGYKPYETGNLQIVIDNPKENAKKYADILHEKLKPHKVLMEGTIKTNDKKENVLLIPYKNDPDVIDYLIKKYDIDYSDSTGIASKKGVVISSHLADKLNLKIDDNIIFSYVTKFRDNYDRKLKITEIVQENNNFILINDEELFKKYYSYIPKNLLSPEKVNEYNLKSDILPYEYKLLERSYSSEALRKKQKQERKDNTNQAKYDINSMYEMASDVLKMEMVLNLITISAVLILFFIILIGVINTLRMTIRERTKEIGTIRAIGMLKKDVRNIFITETFLLTCFSCITGIIIAIILMKIAGSITINTSSPFGMLLLDKHLHFKIEFVSIFINFIIILFIALLTAYFPARNAANMLITKALRHAE